MGRFGQVQGAVGVLLVVTLAAVSCSSADDADGTTAGNATEETDGTTATTAAEDREDGTTTTGGPSRSTTSRADGEAEGGADAETDAEQGGTPATEGGGLVVIDPGHNGANGAHPEIINQQVDAGGFQKACNTTGAATPDGVTESRINWEVAQRLEAELAAAGVEVLLTREDDDGVGPCIDERGQMAADAGADLLISLHADGAPAELAGFHVIHPGPRPGYTDDTVAPSTDLAGLIRDELVGAGIDPATYAGENGLHQRDDIGTLNRSGVPAVMVEAGNLQNSDDIARLTSSDGQSRVVGALTAAVLAFLGR